MDHMNKIIFNDSYQYIISIDNLLSAWQEFVCGKQSRKDVQIFEFNLMKNILELHRDLTAKTYTHSRYHAFNISDPKPRNIHKAGVRDRLLHHAIYRILYPSYDRIFIADSYSCRRDKGTHRALNRFRNFAYKVSQNHTRTCWVLKCDIKKFFASIDHDVLKDILYTHIIDQDTCWLLEKIIGSFHSSEVGKGLPLGNLTSQLLVNIYMNEFDQFVKHRLKFKYYIRYADDFVFLSHDRTILETVLNKVDNFLNNSLCLQLHPHKVFIKSFASGVDFLGWVHFPDHCVLRPATKRRIFNSEKLQSGNHNTIQSYLGLLSYGNTFKLANQILVRTLKNNQIMVGLMQYYFALICASPSTLHAPINNIRPALSGIRTMSLKS
jgi:retron-type reverse transcriptase